MNLTLCGSYIHCPLLLLGPPRIFGDNVSITYRRVHRLINPKYMIGRQYRRRVVNTTVPDSRVRMDDHHQTSDWLSGLFRAMTTKAEILKAANYTAGCHQHVRKRPRHNSATKSANLALITSYSYCTRLAWKLNGNPESSSIIQHILSQM
jgi:hypothetical protein